MKAGWKTSEFWVTTGVMLAGILVQCGFVNSKDLASITDGWSQAVVAAFTLITQATAAILYMRGRNALKAAQDQPIGQLSPTSMHSNAGWLIAVGLVLCSGAAYAQAPDRAPIITTATTPAYFLPWRAWMHGQIGANQQQPAPIIVNPPAAPTPSTDPAVVTLLQQQIQLHQQQVFLQQQIASVLSAGVAHQSAPPYYPAPPGVQTFPSAPAYPVQPLPVSPQYPVQPLPVTPQYPVQPLPVAPVAPVQPLPVAPQYTPQVLPVAPLAPKAAPQAIPVMPGASAYQRFTHALAIPVK